MRENEFEKRVQQRMEDFGLHPSGEVWLNVERRIRREKKRRFIFWWVIAISGISGGAFVLLFAGNKDKKQVIVQQQNTKPIISSDSTTTKLKASAVIPAISTREIGQDANRNESKLPNISLTKVQKSEVQQLPKQQTKSLSQKRTSPVKEIGNHQQQGIIAMIVEPKNSDTVYYTTGTMNAPAQNANKDLNEMISRDSLAMNKIVLEKNDSIVAAQAPGQKEKKITPWNWGISVSAGRSGIVRDLQLFNGPENFSNSGGGGLPIASPGDSASALKSSGSWALEGFARRLLSSKLSLQAGVGYQYFSTKMTTGERVDSPRLISNGFSQGVLVNEYYRLPTQADQTPYTNNYHLLTLSAELSWMFLNKGKIKISWNNGLIYSRLLGSSMLHYDDGITGYYKNNELLSKNHLLVSTGFSIPLTGRLQLNPFIIYSLTPVLQHNHSPRTNFTNYGVKLRFLLNKK